jgi:2'-5' RNA ligase
VASRRRLGVALLLDPPVADEVNGLRRGLGDRSLGRIDAHVTLVPPVNVRADDVDTALEIVRAAARDCGRPFSLILGPPGTFAPANPVVHLPVSGDVTPLRRLRDATFAGPLQRTLAWPWIPHVTLADDADAVSIPPTLAALASFQVVARIDRVVVLEERRGPAGRRWEPFADADLAPGAMVGRGGLDLMLVQGRVLDPGAAALLVDAGCELPDPGRSAPLVVTGLVAGRLVGVAVAWRTDAGGRIAVAVAPAARRAGLGRQLLVHTEAGVRVAGWDCPVLAAPPPAGFYRACSRWSVSVEAG